MGPIVITGMQRSGTSMLRAIVGSHPDVAMFQLDLPFWTEIRPQPGRAAPELLTGHHKATGSEHQVEPDELPKRGGWATMAAAFMGRYAEVRGKPRWGMKEPGAEFHVGTIRRMFPDAKVVHVVRDPRAVAASHRNVEGGSWPYGPWRHMAQWRRSTRIACTAARRHPESFMVVRYEDLVADPKGTTLRLCDHAGVDFSPDMLKMDGHPGYDGHNSSFDRPAVEPPDDPLYSRVLARELDRLGYPHDGRPTVADRVRLGLGAVGAWAVRFRRARLGWLKRAVRAIIPT